MSRVSFRQVRFLPCFPRVSGDEPFILGKPAEHMKFSPRERG